MLYWTQSGAFHRAVIIQVTQINNLKKYIATRIYFFVMLVIIQAIS